MSLIWVLLFVLLVLALFGTMPVFPYNAHWGFGLSGGIGIVILVVILLVLLLR